MTLRTYKTEATAKRGVKRAFALVARNGTKPAPQWFVTVEPNGFRWAIAAMIDGRKVYLSK